MKRIIGAFLIIILTLIFAAGCNSGQNTNEGSGTGKSDELNQQTTAGESSETVHDDPDELLKGMSLEEKVGQLFIMSLRNLPGYPEVTDMNDEVKRRIEENHLGGIILFSENIITIPQTKKLIEDLKDVSKIPLFMAVDEEGGATSRINKSTLMHSTVLPSNYEIGKTGDRELARKAGALIAEEIASLGFNMDFAPVADVNTNPKNPVIGKRSFGDNPELVADMVKAEVKGMQENNIIPVIKHFPGHGDTATDTHTGAVSIEHDRERMDKIELYPFREGINAGVEAIMTAHIQVPKITKDEMPSSLSRTIITDLLRKEMKFDGLVITDALEMGAISQNWSSAEASILAFEAGADILLMPLSIEEAYQGLLYAVKEGRVTEERLNESVRRILSMKKERGILDNKKTGLDPEKILGSEEHLKVAGEIKDKANSKE